jgi:hypothetical protein
MIKNEARKRRQQKIKYQYRTNKEIPVLGREKE